MQASGRERARVSPSGASASDTIIPYILMELRSQGNPQGGYTFGNETQFIDSKISDAAMHETYMLPFAEAVREGSASVMCSYNQLNGVNACEDPATLNLIKSVSPEN
jgi:hypothetical protein